MIKNGFLVPPVVFAASTAPFSILDTKVSQNDTVLLSAVKRWISLCKGKRTIAFCYTVKQSKQLVEHFKVHGFRAKHIDGTTNDTIREDYFTLLHDAHIDVISSVGVLSEGFDLPSVEAIIMLRPTDSKGLYLQQIGRGLRISPGKQRCIVLDEVNNIYRHGPVDSLISFEWQNDEVMEQGNKKVTVTVAGEPIRLKLVS